MKNKLQCKDILDKPILEFLLGLNGKWSNWFGNQFDNSVTHAMPMLAENGSQNKLALAKMRQLIKRGLVEGCGCGCRGDFVITDEGKEYLKQLKP